MAVIPDRPSPGRKSRAAARSSRSSSRPAPPLGVNALYTSGRAPVSRTNTPPPTHPAFVQPGQGKYVNSYPNQSGQRSVPAAPAPRVPSSGGSGGIGSGSTGGISAFSAPAGGDFGGGAGFGAESAPIAPPPPSQDEFLAQDAELIDSRSNAEREYQNLIAQLARQRGEYELDNKNTLRNMGWMGDQGWNQQDRLTGYGQAYQNQLGDFASRGLLDSSLYGNSLNDLNRGFGRQRDDLQEALSSFLKGQEQDRTQADAAKTAAITAAQRQAIARYAAQYGGL